MTSSNFSLHIFCALFLQFLLLTVSLLSTSAFAHSFLTYPEPYTRRTCKNANCPICPRFLPENEMNNTESRPFTTWKRGENVPIVWVKNNHGGGFVRLAFVPVTDAMNFEEHGKRAFYYGCWEQGVHMCEGSFCGADKTSRAFKRIISVPEVLPDGVYIFAYLWYGGIEATRQFGKFSDYESCSFIRIQDGAPLKEEFQPFFEDGEMGSNKGPNGTCLTSAVAPIECKTGCENKPVFYDYPLEFQDGNQPRTITPADYGLNMDISGLSPTLSISPQASSSTSTFPSATLSNIPITSALPSITPSVSPSSSVLLSPSASSSVIELESPSGSAPLTPSASNSVVASESSMVSPSVSTFPLPLESSTPSPSMTESELVVPSAIPSTSTPSSLTNNDNTIFYDNDPGVCEGQYCCATSCEVCDPKLCFRKEGGTRNCCPEWIKYTGRSCHLVGAPCKMNEQKERMYI